MSKVVNFKNKKEIRRLQDLDLLLNDLDLVGEILYNNLEYDGIFKLIEQLEELRFIYSLEWDRLNQFIPKDKND